MRTAFFPVRTLASLPADNIEALAMLCAEFERFEGHARQLPEHHDDYVESLSILRAFAMARDAKLEPLPEIGPQRHANISGIASYFSQLRTTVRTELSTRNSRTYFESKTEEYMALFVRAAVYEFPDSDFKRAQELLNELRDLIRGSSLLADEHKRRLLRKLEAMHGELHKKTSDIDRFWGFLGEAGIAMRKFGEDLKPISERVLELGTIVLGVIFAKEGIKALPEVGHILLANETHAAAEMTNDQ